MNHVSSYLVRIAAAVGTALLLVLGAARPAAADNVDKLVKDLSTGSDYKIRLSAAASLAKLGDERAIPAFIKALGKDKEKTVRGAAAVGLGKVVTGDTDEELRTDAIAALDKAAKKDKDAFVKKQAKKALDKLKKLDDSGASVASGGIFVDIGSMAASAKVGDDASAMKALMKKTVEKTFGKNASEMVIKWPGGKSPSKKDLSSKKTDGYHVDGTLNEITTKTKGSAVIVSCKVNMLIASYPDKSMFGFLNGGASVQASNDEKDIELAKKDCVMAVVEDLVIKKIIPTIHAKSGS